MAMGGREAAAITKGHGGLSAHPLCWCPRYARCLPPPAGRASPSGAVPAAVPKLGCRSVESARTGQMGPATAGQTTRSAARPMHGMVPWPVHGAALRVRAPAWRLAAVGRPHDANRRGPHLQAVDMVGQAQGQLLLEEGTGVDNARLGGVAAEVVQLDDADRLHKMRLLQAMQVGVIRLGYGAQRPLLRQRGLRCRHGPASYVAWGAA
jgi:hypothetical protein